MNYVDCIAPNTGTLVGIQLNEYFTAFDTLPGQDATIRCFNPHMPQLSTPFTLHRAVMTIRTSRSTTFR